MHTTIIRFTRIFKKTTKLLHVLDLTGPSSGSILIVVV